MRAKFKGDLFSRKHEELLQIKRKKDIKIEKHATDFQTLQ